MDSVWNYGLFDFNTPHFVYRFVKGETDYMVGGYPFAWFLPEYVQTGRRVLEQEINLTQDEAHRLRALLRRESLPQNCVYRYNYVKNNCATRITMRLQDVVGQRIIFPDTVVYGTFRNEMRHFHRNYPWYQFGIDLALGSGLDYSLRPEEEMFTPVEMSRGYGGAHLEDGRPLVRATRELAPDSGRATCGPTPWYLTPMALSLLILVISVALSIWMLLRKRLWRPAYSIWFALLGILGIVTAFLVFTSEHEATSPNILILWLNPLQLIPAICIWWRRSRFAATAMMWYNIIVITIMLILWPFQSQSGNPAIFPLAAATEILAITYAILEHSVSYDINGKGSTSRRADCDTGRNPMRKRQQKKA